MYKKVFLFTAVLLIVTGAIFLFNKKPSQYYQSSHTTKLKVVTTLYPLYDFVQNIGFDNVSVTLLLPPGVEPHAFEPKPHDVIAIHEADIFVYTGKFMEVWAEDIVKGITNKDVTVIDTSKNITVIPSEFHDADEPAGSSDPHIWLDFANAQIMVENITQGLIEKDPKHADFYREHASLYKKKLKELDNTYTTTFNTCKTKEVVYGGHYAFGYLAKRYGLHYIAAQGISPDSEPTATDMVRLVKQIKDNKIAYVFYEELSSPKISETLVKETGIKMLLLNAAHNITKQDLDNNISYLSIMEKNLDNLTIGLQCQ